MTQNKDKYRNTLEHSEFIKNLKAGYYIILPKEILFGFEEVPVPVKFFYGVLIHYGNISVSNGNVINGRPIVYPSQLRLAGEMGLSQPTISRYIRQLEEAGLLEVHSQGNGKSNFITLITPNEIETYSPVNETYAEMNRNDPETYSPVNTIYKDNYKGEIDRDSDAEHPTFSLKESRKGKTSKKQQSVEDIIQTNMSRTPKVREQKPKLPKVAVETRNSKTIGEYFQQKYSGKFDGTPLMTGKEFSLFKKMIDHYGYDKVVEFIDFTIDRYDAFRREKGLNGNPTVGMIWGFRSYLEEKVNIYEKEAEPTKEPEALDEESAW